VIHRVGLTVLLALSLLPGLGAGATIPASQQGRACHLPGHVGPLRCIQVTVPLDHASPDGDTLVLHVTVAPAFRQSARADPLFVLAGGPGQAGSDILPLLDSAFRSVRATRDIVLIDQRGTGLSGKLDCDSTRSLEEKPLAQQEDIVAACLRSLNRPFAFYHTENAARDLELVRARLGYDILNLWGGSYGTRLAQTYARLYPQQVRAMILDSVAAPEQIVFAWGRDAQSALDAVFADCQADAACHAAYPMLQQRFESLLERVNGGNLQLDFRHPRTTARTRLALHPASFLQLIRTMLYSAHTRARVPFIIDSASQGNWAPLLAQMVAVGDMSSATPALGLMLSVVCAEDIPRLTPAILAEERRSSFLGGMELRIIPEWCRFVDVPARPYQPPTPIDAPVLLLSGALDPVTPPRRAQAAARHIERAQQLTVANGGHIVSMLGCIPRLLREFLDRPAQPLSAECMDNIAPAGFQLGPAGPQP
jgi:pimeloyl-ACP methyl ester carboxylesterase